MPRISSRKARSARKIMSRRTSSSKKISRRRSLSRKRNQRRISRSVKRLSKKKQEETQLLEGGNVLGFLKSMVPAIGKTEPPSTLPAVSSALQESRHMLNNILEKKSIFTDKVQKMMKQDPPQPTQNSTSSPLTTTPQGPKTP
jgi:hypothetical protein